MAEPAAFHVEACERCGVELLAGPIVCLAVGVAAPGGERGGELQDLLLLAQVGGCVPTTRQTRQAQKRCASCAAKAKGSAEILRSRREVTGATPPHPAPSGLICVDGCWARDPTVSYRRASWGVS